LIRQQNSWDNKRVVMLTILNPALHSRIYFKEALTLSQNNYQVFIIGQHKKTKPFLKSSIAIIPARIFGRNLFDRFSLQIRIFFIAFRLKAVIYHLHTPELLIVGLLLKCFTKAKIIYDIHEDYYKNIIYGGYYPFLLKYPLAWAMRAVEWISSLWVSRFIYAEGCYENILHLKPDRYIVIRNFFQPTPLVIASSPLPSFPQKRKSPPLPMMLYTGTIAENWGIWQTIALWKSINQHTPIQLVVAGHSQNNELIKKIELETKNKERFKMIGGNKYVDYQVIQTLIQGCTFGVGLYLQKKSLERRIPTKFYEFMHYRKPLIFTQNTTWNALNKRLHFGVEADISNLKETTQKVLEHLKTNFANCYAEPIEPQEYNWKFEAKKLVEWYKQII